MTMENRYIINLDFKTNAITQINYKQCDANTSVIEIHALDGGVPVDITNQTVKLNFKRSDGSIVSQDSTNGVSILSTTSGIIQCVLSKNTLSVPGDVDCEVVFTNSENVLTTDDFTFFVQQSIGQLAVNYIASINEKLDEWQNTFNSSETARQNTFNLSESARNNTFNSSEGERQNTFNVNEDIRQTNETARQTNETARQTAFSEMQHLDANLELSSARQGKATLLANLQDIESKIGSIGNTKTFKGSTLFASLPTSGNTNGDYYWVTDKNTNYCWNGTTWVDIGNNLNIGDNTITESKTSFMKNYCNMFDYTQE